LLVRTRIQTERLSGGEMGQVEWRVGEYQKRAEQAHLDGQHQ
jgi:hypothetical protein